MDRVRWEQVQLAFHAVASLPPGERGLALDQACGGDGTLKALVAQLLEADAQDVSLLDGDVTDVAHQLFGQPDSSLLPGQQIGPYRVVRPLDHEGGMGLVYLAHRDDLDQRVAIKVLRDAWVSADRRERFAREQRTLARLAHRSIPQLYDADTLADGTPWFAMEFVEGVWLTDYCAQHASSLSTRLRLFRDVCEAVLHAHQHLIIHRDLKPANILVLPDGTVKLLDFGISKQLESSAFPPATQTVVRLMTPTHAAPEQIAGSPASVQADVYSLGVILYELLTGLRPFDLEGLAPRDAETIVLEHQPLRPSEVARQSAQAPHAAASAWSDLDVLCLTAMHKDPARRYQTVEGLIADIDHFRLGEPIRARADSMRYRTAKLVKRHARLFLAAGVILATIVSLIAFYTVRLTGARNRAMAAAARTERIREFMVNLFDAGESEVAPASELRVLTLLDRGLQEAKSLDQEPDIQAELYYTLGGLYQKLGQHDRADTLLRQALERRRQLLGADHPDTVDSLIAVGLLREEEAKLDEAERLLREAVDLSRRSPATTDALVAKATAAVGKVLEERGAYGQAIPLFETAARLYGAGAAFVSERSAVMTALADTHFYAGHLDVSDAINRDVLALDRRLHGNRHPNVADDLLNLGAVQSSLGNYREAERSYREALDILRDWYTAGHPETASAMTILASSLVSQQKYDEAAGLLRQSLAIQERVYPPNHPRIGFVLNELGSLQLRQNDLKGAEESFIRALDIYRHIYAGRHFRIGVGTANLASVYLEAGRYRDAERLFREAIDTLTETQSAGHMNTAIARIKLGRTLVRLGRYAEAEPHLLTGYDALVKQVVPSATWLRAARKDLVTVYVALGRLKEADSFRGEESPAAAPSPVDTLAGPR